MTDDPQPDTGLLEFRSATLAGVSFPNRTIELIVLPYEEETLVEYRGRMVTEIVSRGAFDGIQRRPSRIKANRDHDVRRVIGRAVSLHPEASEGLVAEIRISKTDLGTETLILADDGVLDASAAFMPFSQANGPAGERWETRSRRRINRAWLGHIALVPDPAYEGARVLAVRNADPAIDGEQIATPHLDIVRGWQLQQDYDLLQ